MLSPPFSVAEMSAGEEPRFGVWIEGQVPVLGRLAFAQAVDVDVLAGVAAVAEGHRGLEEDGGVAVVGQDVVEREVLQLHAGLLEDPA